MLDILSVVGGIALLYVIDRAYLYYGHHRRIIKADNRAKKGGCSDSAA